MNAREEILGRVRRALADVPDAEQPSDVPVARDYSRGGGPAAGSPEAVALLAGRLTDYGAGVRVVPAAEAADAVAQVLTARGARSVVTPPGFPPEWRADVDPARFLGDEPRLPFGELDRLDSTVTTVATAVAETGTLVLDGGPGQGRRVLTLIPDHHLCVVRAAQVVASVPEALAALDPVRPLTFISGPSATSDIELDRIEGVHGPRTLDVVITT